MRVPIKEIGRACLIWIGCGVFSVFIRIIDLFTDKHHDTPQDRLLTSLVALAILVGIGIVVYFIAWMIAQGFQRLSK